MFLSALLVVSSAPLFFVFHTSWGYLTVVAGLALAFSISWRAGSRKSICGRSRAALASPITNAPLVASCDKKNWFGWPCDEQVENLRSAWGFAQAHGDWQALINDPNVDVVAITTPNHLHYPMAMAAIAAGRDAMADAARADAGTLVTEKLSANAARWASLYEACDAKAASTARIMSFASVFTGPVVQ